MFSRNLIQQLIAAPSCRATLSRSFSTSNRLAGADILSAKQFDRDLVELSCNFAEKMRDSVNLAGGANLLQGKVMGALAFEPSTRTFSSFTAAMLRLGGSVLPLNSTTSSAVKGETLEDTVRVMEKYCDVMVLRHPTVGSAQKAAAYSSIPIINAGDGQGEHPTQALLDIYTIKQELGKLDGLTVTLLGDLKYGRTVHSLVQLFSLFNNVTVNYISPEALSMPQDIIDTVEGKNGLKQNKIPSLDKALPHTDVLYVTRVQKERFADEASYLAMKGSYVITPKVMEQAKSKMIVMHPLPRVDELSPELDNDPRAAYFRTVGHGLHLRMALLAAVCGSKFFK